MKTPLVYVVILTFNRWDNTRACLDAVTRSTYPNLRVLIVDNVSTDGTPTELRKNYPQITLLENGANLGYAEGNNIGMRFAMEQDADYVAILNNDVVVGLDWLEPLVNALSENPRATFAGPLVYHADEPTIIQSAGGILPADWHPYHRSPKETDAGKFQIVEAVDWLTGCTLLARSSSLQTIGLLDPAFYMYGEDVDWCVRARAAGQQVLFVPQSHVWHKGVMRNYKPAPHVTYYSARNELQLMRKHHAGTSTVLRAWTRDLRTLTSWTLRPQWRDQRAHRNALARALKDFVRGATGRATLV